MILCLEPLRYPCRIYPVASNHYVNQSRLGLVIIESYYHVTFYTPLGANGKLPPGQGTPLLKTNFNSLSKNSTSPSNGAILGGERVVFYSVIP